MKETYRLWSFQSVSSIKELKNKGILQASWDRYSQSDYFIKSYQWMVKQMAERSISDNSHPPIWAWHSCWKYENAPRLVDARSLLSDMDLKAGIQTIEFECPTDLVLLSKYGVWNMMQHEIFASKEEVDIDIHTIHRLFATGRKQFRKHDCIQAALPYLMLEWVKEIRSLDLKPGDFSYNTDDEV